MRLSFDLEGHGFGAVLVTKDSKSQEIKALMETSKSWAAEQLKSFSDEWKPPPQRIVPIAKTAVNAGDPKDMVKIPASDFLFRVDGLEIEGDNWAGLDVQYPWEDSARRHQLNQLPIARFWIDR